jgi:hypothetical protein
MGIRVASDLLSFFRCIKLYLSYYTIGVVGDLQLLLLIIIIIINNNNL